MTKIVINQYLEREDKKYRLSGVIYHYGRSADEGHYYAILKFGQKWFLCNDEKIT